MSSTAVSAPSATGLENLPAYLSIPEVAEVAGLSRSTIWREVWAGHLGSVVIARRTRRVPRVALLLWLQAKGAA